MNPLAQTLIGLLTTAVFLGVGTTMILEGRTWIGAPVVLLGFVRGFVLARQVLARRAERDEDDEG